MSDEIRGKVEWFKDMQFIGRIEGDKCSVILGEGGISPMKLLLLSVAGCTAYDVVMILQKMREPVKGLEVEISGERRESIRGFIRGSTFITKSMGMWMRRRQNVP